MSHFAVLVCLEGEKFTHRRLEAALAPFDENREVKTYRSYENGEPSAYWCVDALRREQGLNPDDATLTWGQVAEAYNQRYPKDRPLRVDEQGRAYTMSTVNPQAKWDYWRIGGRWSGHFRHRAGQEDHVIPVSLADWDSPTEIPALSCNGGQKSVLDLSGQRETAVAAAAEQFDQWNATVKGTPEARPWSEFLALTDRVEDYTIEQARQEYLSQPRVEVIQNARPDSLWDCPIERYQVPRKDFLAQARAQAVPGRALLTTDGRWMEPGQMGWFGLSNDTPESYAAYLSSANAHIDALPKTTWLVVVDCHI